MINLEITDADRKDAKSLFQFKQLRNSITKGEGNISGALGEVLVRKYFNGVQQNTFDYDIIIDDKKIDVKTKRFTPQYTPNSKWNLNIPDFNTSQDCDFYCFVGMAEDLSKAYLYGFIKKDDFYRKAIFGKKGEIDPNGNGIWRFRADCYNLLVEELSLELY